MNNRIFLLTLISLLPLANLVGAYGGARLGAQQATRTRLGSAGSQALRTGTRVPARQLFTQQPIMSSTRVAPLRSSIPQLNARTFATQKEETSKIMKLAEEFKTFDAKFSDITQKVIHDSIQTFKEQSAGKTFEEAQKIADTIENNIALKIATEQNKLTTQFKAKLTKTTNESLKPKLSEDAIKRIQQKKNQLNQLITDFNTQWGLNSKGVNIEYQKAREIFRNNTIPKKQSQFKLAKEKEENVLEAEIIQKKETPKEPPYNQNLKSKIGWRLWPNALVLGIGGYGAYKQYQEERKKKQKREEAARLAQFTEKQKREYQEFYDNIVENILQNPGQTIKRVIQDGKQEWLIDMLINAAIDNESPLHPLLPALAKQIFNVVFAHYNNQQYKNFADSLILQALTLINMSTDMLQASLEAAHDIKNQNKEPFITIIDSIERDIKHAYWATKKNKRAFELELALNVEKLVKIMNDFLTPEEFNQLIDKRNILFSSLSSKLTKHINNLIKEKKALAPQLANTQLPGKNSLLFKRYQDIKKELLDIAHNNETKLLLDFAQEQNDKASQAKGWWYNFLRSKETLYQKFLQSIQDGQYEQQIEKKFAQLFAKNITQMHSVPEYKEPAELR